MQKKVFLTALLALSLAFSLSAQRVSITVSDKGNVEGKWNEVEKAGAFIFEEGSAAPVESNLAVSVKDAEKGLFQARAGRLRSGRKYRLAIYAPYSEDVAIKDGKMCISVPAEQDGALHPIDFGSSDFSAADLKGRNLDCDFAARTTNLVLKLSSRCLACSGWNLEKIVFSTEDGLWVAGDALMDMEKGTLSVDPDGKYFNSITYNPEVKAPIGDGYKSICLKALPSRKLHGTGFRIDYTFSRDGREMTICHDVLGINFSEGYTLTLEERIPEIIAGDWHTSEFPGRNWEFASPESMGYSSERLENLRTYIKDSLTTTSMMIVVGGKVIFSMGDLAEPVRIASCRKSLISMLYGKYVENGTIDLDATLEDLGIDDKGGLLPIERKATVRHLITARSGVYHPASNDGDDSKHAPARGSVEPGTYYLYNNWDFNAAGGVFEQLTGKDIYDAFRDDIALPTGMQDYKVENQHKTGISDPTMSRYLAYHFWLSTRDMARVAYLMLHRGQWNGTQVISEDWVKTTTSVVTPRAEMNPEPRHRKEFDYGYLWWIFCKEFKNYDPAVYGGGYTATGSGGQYITVLPALDMVVAHKDKTERSQKSVYYKLIARIAACKLQQND